MRKSNDAGGVGYHTATVPTSPNYLVEADVHVKSILPSDHVGVVGRWNITATTGAGTFYLARYETTTGQWQLVKSVNGVLTVIGTPFAQTLTTGSTYRLSLDMHSTTIRLLVNGVERISVVDSSVTLAGRAGVRLGEAGDTALPSDLAGLHVDNMYASPAVADSKSGSTNTGDYFNGVTLGVAGAIANDTNKAATFDGVDDYASVTRQIADDFSIEFWFKSTQGRGTGTQWETGAAVVDASVTGPGNDFGVSLRSDGKVIAGVGGTADTSIVSSIGGYNDGTWQHVVFTRTKATGALQLYVDGELVGSATGSTASLTSSSVINFGRLASSTNYFAGSLDEVAMYNVVLTTAQITSHYVARQ